MLQPCTSCTTHVFGQVRAPTVPDVGARERKGEPRAGRDGVEGGLQRSVRGRPDNAGVVPDLGGSRGAGVLVDSHGELAKGHVAGGGGGEADPHRGGYGKDLHAGCEFHRVRWSGHDVLGGGEGGPSPSLNDEAGAADGRVPPCGAGGGCRHAPGLRTAGGSLEKHGDQRGAAPFPEPVAQSRGTEEALRVEGYGGVVRRAVGGVLVLPHHKQSGTLADRREGGGVRGRRDDQWCQAPSRWVVRGCGRVPSWQRREGSACAGVANDGVGGERVRPLHQPLPRMMSRKHMYINPCTSLPPTLFECQQETPTYALQGPFGQERLPAVGSLATPPPLSLSHGLNTVEQGLPFQLRAIPLSFCYLYHCLPLSLLRHPTPPGERRHLSRLKSNGWEMGGACPRSELC
eukprot:Sspe_Gene.47556::Locus_24306_Transcript_2_2_Confidence_0.667_Length_2104::g.47556::m.47556